MDPSGRPSSLYGGGGSIVHPPQPQPQKKTPPRWLLCYPAGGADGSDRSESSESESNLSTPSPTDHGFRIPNSYSNERPNSLPVALQNSIRGNGKNLHKF